MNIDTYLLYALFGTASVAGVALGSYLRRTSPLLYGIALGSTVSVTVSLGVTVSNLDHAKAIGVVGFLTAAALIVGAVRRRSTP